MIVLLLNAGSSSLKATLMESGVGKVLARGLADWAGSTARYEYAGADGKERTENVRWKNHAEAVRRFVFDLTHAEPVVMPDPSALAAGGHRVVHGGPFTSSVRVTPAVRSRLIAL